MVVFTKFDGQIIQESGKLDYMDDAVKWDKARENAEITFQRVYLPKVYETNYPPKGMCAWVVGIITIATIQRDVDNTSTDMDMPGNDCPELTENTADAIDNASLRELFISTQMNNLVLCGKAGFKWVSP